MSTPYSQDLSCCVTCFVQNLGLSVEEAAFYRGVSTCMDWQALSTWRYQKKTQPLLLIARISTQTKYCTNLDIGSISSAYCDRQRQSPTQRCQEKVFTQNAAGEMNDQTWNTKCQSIKATFFDLQCSCIKVIKTAKYSAVEGTVYGREHHNASISWLLLQITLKGTNNSINTLGRVFFPRLFSYLRHE